MIKKINIVNLKEEIPYLTMGQKILLSGLVFTARDAAHQKLIALRDENKPLPIDLKNAVIYYTGPTKTPEGGVIGSAGPTTSARMDKFTPLLLDLGVIATIGKGPRSEEVRQAIVNNKGIYLCALGGAGALAASHIVKNQEVAFKELGTESIKQLTFEDFPLIVGIDCNGCDIFKKDN